MIDLLPKQELPEDEVHLWYVLTDRVGDPARLEAFAAVLSEEETRRWQRFSFEEGRLQYLVSHGFVRMVLSHYAAVHPAEWRFVRNGYGKPEVAVPALVRPLCFNLSHTHGLAACVVARTREVGVDAEDWQRQGRDVSAALIRRCLSPTELACYQGIPAVEQKRAFFDYWTLKEAYLKARGFGLTLPVEEITFHWPSGVPHVGEVAVSFGDAIGDDPTSWYFERHIPSARHKIAVAARRIAGAGLKVVVREFGEERETRESLPASRRSVFLFAGGVGRLWSAAVSPALAFGLSFLGKAKRPKKESGGDRRTPKKESGGDRRTPKGDNNRKDSNATPSQ